MIKDEFDTHIKDLYKYLDESEREQFTRGIFNSLVTALKTQYGIIYYDDKTSTDKLDENIEFVKSILFDQVSDRIPVKKHEDDGFDRSKKMDASFEFDAGYDLNRLMEEVSKSKG